VDLRANLKGDLNCVKNATYLLTAKIEPKLIRIDQFENYIFSRRCAKTPKIDFETVHFCSNSPAGPFTELLHKNYNLFTASILDLSLTVI
jgi:hypothetical protein